MTREVIENGIHLDMPAERYFAADGVSHSMLKHMDPTPAHLLAYLARQEQEAERPIALTLGTLVHERVLTPGGEFKQVAVKPEGLRFNTKEGKAWREEHLAAGKQILTQDEYVFVVCAVENILAHPECRPLFESDATKTEVSVFCPFSLGGTVQRKARIDIVSAGNALADIKTCQSAHKPDFASAILDFGYHTQAAYYLDIWADAVPVGQEAKSHFVFIAVEKTPPYLVAVYDIAARAIKEGRRINIERLQKYIECKETAHFPGYSQSVEDIDLPAWYWKRQERSIFGLG